MTDLKTLPDRELDVWLAEHAMGWKWYRRINPINPKYWLDFERPPGAPLVGEAILTTPVDAEDLGLTPEEYDGPQFCTGAGASKALRDRMRELGYWCQLRNGWRPELSECWAGFTPHGVSGWNGRPDNWTAAPTEERAVAEAAAAALGYGKENERG